jgi:hypothetical protein
MVSIPTHVAQPRIQDYINIQAVILEDFMNLGNGMINAIKGIVIKVRHAQCHAMSCFHLLIVFCT